MEIEFETNAEIGLVVLAGRFDTHGSKQFDERLAGAIGETKALCIDLRDVPYISSAAIRILARELQRLGSSELMALVNPGKYAREVLRVTGVERLFRIYGNRGEALMALRGRLAGGYRAGAGEEETDIGTFTYTSGSNVPTGLDILGNVADVLHARVTAESLVLKKFSETEYSIGLGAMGGSPDESAPLLGEMVTVGGTMVWLPTDGHDTPDFLVPRSDSELVGIRTAFNASLVGAFNEYCLFRASTGPGAAMGEIYTQLFNRARAQRGDQAAVVAIAMCANLTEVYGSGVTKAPIQSFAPADGRMIIEPDLIKQWFEADTEPRRHNVTALCVGFGLNLEADLGGYKKEDLDAVFYVHPANVGDKKHLLHNHAVMFEPLPLPADDAALEDVILETVEKGTFTDMRHLLDTTRINHALIGVSYISYVRR